jgi:hypothetical protein
MQWAVQSAREPQNLEPARSTGNSEREFLNAKIGEEREIPRMRGKRETLNPEPARSSPKIRNPK